MRWSATVGSRGALGELLSQCGSREALIARSGASTVCGSCSPLLAELCGDSAAPLPRQSSLLLAGLMALILAVVIPLLTPVPYADSVQHWLRQFDPLWSDGLYKQVSGFSLLALSLLGLGLSLNKRMPRLSWGSFNVWRLLHAALGVLCLMVLLAHTGLRLGENLNAYLMSNFLALALLGGLSAAVIAGESSLGARLGKRLRRWCAWAHIAMFWPLPTLLTFHVISVYYF